MNVRLTIRLTTKMLLEQTGEELQLHDISAVKKFAVELRFNERKSMIIVLKLSTSHIIDAIIYRRKIGYSIPR